MADPIVIDVGDSLTIYEVPVVDGDGNAVNLTGGTVRLYAKGRTNADRPATAANVTVANCGFTIASKVVTCPATAGIVVGMRVIHAQAPPGTWVTVVTSNVSFTMTQPAIATAATQSVVFWHGVLMDITAPRAALGLPMIQGLGALLSPGVVPTGDEIYDDEVYYKTAAGLEGVSSRSTFIGRRPL